MRLPTTRQVVTYVALFGAVSLASLIAMVGVTLVAMSWTGDEELAHGVRIVLALVVSAAVLHSMHQERGAVHAEHDTQLG